MIPEQILFVDDKKEPEWFLGFGVVVACARNGEEAVRMWTEGSFDTLFLDNDMGYDSIEGWKVLELIIEIRKPKTVYTITNNPVAKKRMFDICKSADITVHSAAVGDYKSKY